ncbi:MAG: hypothetical protein H6732_18065 [Alphaproteobacteria bacterium]|nr:hypothetical protein [Alphaproteobacteria bacterium]
MRWLRWLLASLGVLAILGCSGLVDGLDMTAVPPPSPSWVGTWEGPGLTVQISADGFVSIDHVQDGQTSSVMAPARSWEHGIEVGFASLTTTWTVDEAPYEVEGSWRMVVQGVPLQRTGDAPPELGAAFQQLDEAPPAPEPAP